MNSLKATYSYISTWFRCHPLLDLSQRNKIIFLCNSDLTHGHRSVGHPLFKEVTGVINLLYKTMTMVMNRNTHLCNFKSDTTIILTRNVTWNSSAPNATPITSYPLTRAMAGGAWKSTMLMGTVTWGLKLCWTDCNPIHLMPETQKLVVCHFLSLGLDQFNRYIKTWIHSPFDIP